MFVCVCLVSHNRIPSTTKTTKTTTMITMAEHRQATTMRDTVERYRAPQQCQPKMRALAGLVVASVLVVLIQSTNLVGKTRMNGTWTGSSRSLQVSSATDMSDYQSTFARMMGNRMASSTLPSPTSSSTSSSTASLPTLQTTPIEKPTGLFRLPETARHWCSVPNTPPLDFTDCDRDGTINAIPMFGGLTNSLKFALLGTLYSMERGECFFLDETNSDLHNRRDKTEQFDSFLQHFFEPMGLSANSAIVEKARVENRIKYLDAVKDLFSNPMVKRMEKEVTTIPRLGIHKLDGHTTKRNALKRLWRPRPAIRNHTCTMLDSTYGLHGDYMAFSIRRGDKEAIENKEYADLNKYIDGAERILQQNIFADGTPKVFVATDDCSVLPVFRNKRPSWTFLSECDGQAQQKEPKGQDNAGQHANGFVLDDVQTWSKHDTEEHFRKFFVELYALVFAKVYVGVSTTNGKSTLCYCVCERVMAATVRNTIHACCTQCLWLVGPFSSHTA